MDLCPVTLQLHHTEASIALHAGNVLRIPGIIKIRQFSPSSQFKSKMALDKFPGLAAVHSVEKVGGRFSWREVPNLGSPDWADLRVQVECLTQKQNELDALMLRDRDGVRQEGERTNLLEDLHDRYLNLKQRQARLEVDLEDLQAQAIQAIEDCEAIVGINPEQQVLP